MLSGQILGNDNFLQGTIQAQVINNGGSGGIEIDGVAQDKGFLRFKDENAHFETILPDSEVTAESENIVSSSAISSFVENKIDNYYDKTEINNTLENYYNKEQVDNTLTNYYNKEQIDESITDVREVAEGKTKSFTLTTLTALGTLLGIDTSIVSDEYTITSTTITYKEQSIELNQGDLFLIVDINVPDYWVSVDNMKIYKMETTKVDLTDYVKNTDYATETNAGVIKINAVYGIRKSSDHTIRTVQATEAEIDSRTSTYKTISPNNLDYAVKSVVGGHITLTQAEYDALVSAGTVDENTYYYIKGE